jgi:hypothetical protein
LLLLAVSLPRPAHARADLRQRDEKTGKGSEGSIPLACASPGC